MKKTTLLFASVLFLLTKSFTQQHQLVKKWESDSIFKVPESVRYDAVNNVLYVSNIDGTEPWGKDGKGSIGKIGTDGKIIAAEWVTGLHAPKGMGLHKGKLYVADLTEVVIIDVATGTIEKKIDVPGADRLNDISVDSKGVIFVSDSRAALSTDSSFLSPSKGAKEIFIRFANNSPDSAVSSK